MTGSVTGIYGWINIFTGLQSLIIYDCDGVLIDSRRSNEAFYNHILAHFGLRP